MPAPNLARVQCAARAGAGQQRPSWPSAQVTLVEAQEALAEAQIGGDRTPRWPRRSSAVSEAEVNLQAAQEA